MNLMSATGSPNVALSLAGMATSLLITLGMVWVYKHGGEKVKWRLVWTFALLTFPPCLLLLVLALSS